MAISANTVWEFQTVGSDDNGGGFDSTIADAGTDYSTQTNAQLSVTDGKHGAGSAVLTSATGGFTAAMIGNTVFVKSGTNFTVGFYQVVGYTDTNTITLDRSLGASANTTGNGVVGIGGCRKLISSNTFRSGVSAGNTIWIKAGTYTMTDNFSSGTLGTIAAPISMLGYNSTRGDNPTGDNRPVLNFGAYTCYSNSYWNVRNLIVTSSVTAFSGGGSGILKNMKITSTSATATIAALNATAAAVVIDCEISHPLGIGVDFSSTIIKLIGNYIHDCVKGIVPNGNSTIINNIISNCTTAIDFDTNINGLIIYGNTIYGAETPAGTGIKSTTGSISNGDIVLNNIIYGFTVGASWGSVIPNNYWDCNDFYNNATDRTLVTAGPNDVSINPGFVNAVSGNFLITGSI